MSIHTLQTQIPAKISSIQPRQRKSVPEPSHGGLEIRFIEIGVEVLGFGSGIHICPYPGDDASSDSSSFICNLDRDVLSVVRTKLIFGGYQKKRRYMDWWNIEPWAWVTTSSPSATSMRMGGKESAPGPYLSTTARNAFFNTSKQI